VDFCSRQIREERGAGKTLAPPPFAVTVLTGSPPKTHPLLDEFGRLGTSGESKADYSVTTAAF